MRVLFLKILLASCLTSLFVLAGLMALVSTLSEVRPIQGTYTDAPCRHPFE